MEERLTILRNIHRDNNTMAGYNDIWQVNFTAMSDEEFKEEIQYISYLLVDHGNNYVN